MKKQHVKFDFKNNTSNPNEKRKEHKYAIGDFILMKNNNRKSKLDELYTGPYKILYAEKNYLKIEDEEGNKIKLNIKNAKPYNKKDHFSKREEYDNRIRRYITIMTKLFILH